MRNRSGARVRNVMVGLVAVALGVGAAAGPVVAGDRSQSPVGEPLSDLEIAAIILIEGWEGLLPEPFDLPFVPIGDSPIEGDPNPTCGAAAQSFRFDGASADADTFSLAALGEGVRAIYPGDASYFQFQQVFTVVLACFRTSPLLTDAVVSEISMAYRLFGQEVLEQSDYPGEPHIQMASVVSSAAVKGTDLPADEFVGGFSFVSGGAFSPAATNPIPTFELWGPQGYFQLWVVPGTPEEIRVNSGDAGELSVDAVSNQQVVVAQSSDLTDTVDPGVQSAAQAALPGLRQELTDSQPAPVEGADQGESQPQPTGETATEEPPTIDPPPDEGEPIADPPSDDDSEPAPAADADQPVAIAPPESATESTATTEPPPSASTDDSNDGSSAGLLVLLLLIAIIAPLLFLFVWFLPRRRRATAADQPRGGHEPTPTGGSGDAGTPSPPTPEHPGGATTTPPVVPGAPPPHVQCDWELRLGTRVLKKVAPGHRPCCVYQLDIESIASIPERGVFLADGQADRNRLPVLRTVGTGLGFEAGATTRTEPDAESVRDAVVNDGAGMVTDWAALATPDGLPPDIAVHLVCGETTEVTVTLESKCRDHDHQYHGMVESHIELSAGGTCTNNDPGDRCDVWLGAAGAGDADVSGDLDLDVATDADLGALALQGERQTHDHDQPDGTAAPVVSGADNGTHGPIVKAGFAWSATFSNEFTLDAAQIIPTATRPTTDRVATSALGAITHALSLAANTIARSCAGTGCGCGATECTCVPSFELVIDAEKQELVVDNTPWTLYRDDASGPRWKAR